jgi:hypothetical protein
VIKQTTSQLIVSSDDQLEEDVRFTHGYEWHRIRPSLPGSEEFNGTAPQ